MDSLFAKFRLTDYLIVFDISGSSIGRFQWFSSKIPVGSRFSFSKNSHPLTTRVKRWIFFIDELWMILWHYTYLCNKQYYEILRLFASGVAVLANATTMSNDGSRLGETGLESILAKGSGGGAKKVEKSRKKKKFDEKKKTYTVTDDDWWTVHGESVCNNIIPHMADEEKIRFTNIPGLLYTHVRSHACTYMYARYYLRFGFAVVVVVVVVVSLAKAAAMRFRIHYLSHSTPCPWRGFREIRYGRDDDDGARVTCVCNTTKIFPVHARDAHVTDLSASDGNTSHPPRPPPPTPRAVTYNIPIRRIRRGVYVCSDEF